MSQSSQQDSEALTRLQKLLESMRSSKSTESIARRRRVNSKVSNEAPITNEDFSSGIAAATVDPSSRCSPAEPVATGPITKPPKAKKALVRRRRNDNDNLGSDEESLISSDDARVLDSDSDESEDTDLENLESPVIVQTSDESGDEAASGHRSSDQDDEVDDEVDYSKLNLQRRPVIRGRGAHGRTLFAYKEEGNGSDCDESSGSAS